jgi:hypothetical protein
MESVGFDPRTSPPHKSFNKVRPTNMPHIVSCYIYMFLIYLNFVYVYKWRGVGPGLSPDPWSFVPLHMTIYDRGIYILNAHGVLLCMVLTVFKI